MINSGSVDSVSGNSVVIDGAIYTVDDDTVIFNVDLSNSTVEQGGKIAEANDGVRNIIFADTNDDGILELVYVEDNGDDITPIVAYEEKEVYEEDPVTDYDTALPTPDSLTGFARGRGVRAG